jgi:hypothetical protein
MSNNSRSLIAEWYVLHIFVLYFTFEANESSRPAIVKEIYQSRVRMGLYYDTYSPKATDIRK